MLGDNILIGMKKINIDDKNRIIIPSIYGAECGEMIYFFEENQLAFRIFGLKKFEQRLKKYEELIEKSSTYEERQKYQRDLDKYTIHFMYSGKLDSQRRILLSKEILEKYDLRDNIIMQGMNDYIRVFKNEEDRNEYILKYMV